MNPVKNDLATTFTQDMEMCGITLTMNEISRMKKSKFRKIVKCQIRELARKYLLDLKSKHSKLDNIGDSYGQEKYLLSSNISTEETQVLFRTRMVEVKSNFKKKHGANLICNFCQNEDTQSHLLLY